MLGISPQKGIAYKFPVKLLKSNLSGFKVTPVIVAGDFSIEKWNAGDAYVQKTSSIANLANTPIVADTSASCTTVMLSLTASEMAADIIIVTARDTDGANDWADNSWVIYPDQRKAVLENKKAIVMVGQVAHLRVYAADGTTVVLDKILKDIAGNDITALSAGQLAIEQAAA